MTDGARMEQATPGWLGRLRTPPPEGSPLGVAGRGGEILFVLVLCAGLSVGIIYARWVQTPVRSQGQPYVTLYAPPHTAAEAMMDQGDGQAYAALAQDPTLARPGLFHGQESDASSAAEAAYRAQRPMLGWLGWAGSLGQATLVPAVLLALAAVGAVILVLGTALNAIALQRRLPLALLAIMAPGSLVLLAKAGPEALGTGWALIGLAVWPRRRGWAVLAFVGAALCRETLLVVPAAIALSELVHRRRLPWILGLPFAAYGAWVTVVWARLHEWPTSAGAGRLSAPWDGISNGHWSLVNVLVALLGVAALVAAVRKLPDPWRMTALAYALLGLVMGEAVWQRWQDFSRPLLPLYVLGLLAVLPRQTRGGRPAPTTGRSEAPSERGDDHTRIRGGAATSSEPTGPGWRGSRTRR